MMSLEQIRLAQNPVLTNLLLGMGQGEMIAERVLPRLPQALRGHTGTCMDIFKFKCCHSDGRYRNGNQGRNGKNHGQNNRRIKLVSNLQCCGFQAQSRNRLESKNR